MAVSRASSRCVIALSLSVPWLPRRALPYIAFVALIADLLSRACDGCVILFVVDWCNDNDKPGWADGICDPSC